MHVEGIADGPGLFEVEEVADELITREGRRSLREAHDAFPFEATERSKELMALLSVDELRQTSTSCSRDAVRRSDVRRLDANGG